MVLPALLSESEEQNRDAAAVCSEAYSPAQRRSAPSLGADSTAHACLFAPWRLFRRVFFEQSLETDARPLRVTFFLEGPAQG